MDTKIQNEEQKERGDIMEVFVLMREFFIEYEKCYEVLGVFDSDHIDAVEIQMKIKYTNDSVWSICLDLNKL